MVSKTDAVPPMPKRRFRTRGSNRRVFRRQSIILGAIFFIITLGFVFLGNFNNSITEKDLDLFNKNLRGGDERSIWVSQNSQPFNENGVAVKAKHLIMVAGHSVTVSGHLKDADEDESDWFLLS